MINICANIGAAMVNVLLVLFYVCMRKLEIKCDKKHKYLTKHLLVFSCNPDVGESVSVHCEVISGCVFR